MKMLADMLSSDPTTITRNVQGLRRPLPNWDKAQSEVVARLGRTELTNLRAVLERVGTASLQS